MGPRVPVGPLPRLAALAIDAGWLAGVACPLLWAAASPGQPWPWATWLATLLLLSAAAVPAWRVLGGTPGELLLSQRVVDAGGADSLRWPQLVIRWALCTLALPAALVGLVWQLGDPRARTWYDRATHTRVVDRGSADPSEVDDPAPFYLLQHLVGELPLAHSLWVNAVIVPLPLWLGLGALDAIGRLHGGLPLAVTLVLLTGWLLLLLLQAWAALGVWRSARRHGRPGARARPLGHVAATLALALLLGALVLAGVRLGPRLLDAGPLLLGRDALGSTRIEVSPDGRRLVVDGPLGGGTAARVQALLAASPQVRLVTLHSAAGRLNEALRIAALVQQRGLATRAQGRCDDVCPLVFLAGSRRQLAPGARLGLHRLSAGLANPPYQALVNRELAARWASAGLTRHLVTKTLATPPGALWQPEADELVAAGLLTQPERPLDVDLPSPQGATATDYAEALNASLLWQALEQRYPGVQAQAAQRMAAAGAQGIDAVQAAGHAVVTERLPALLAQASPETRWLFAEVLAAQVAALQARDPALCRALLQGDALAHRQLPRELAWREAEWLHNALKEAPRDAPPRKPTPVELEVMRHTLGRSAPTALATMWLPASGEPDCNRAQALLADMSQLTAPLRRLALRLMFERG